MRSYLCANSSNTINRDILGLNDDDDNDDDWYFKAAFVHMVG